MKDGYYAFIPFSTDLAADVPQEEFALADGFSIAPVGSRLFGEAVALSREYVDAVEARKATLPERHLLRRFYPDLVESLNRNCAALVSREVLPCLQPEFPEISMYSDIITTAHLVGIRGATRFTPTVERVFAALLVAGRVPVAFSSFFQIGVQNGAVATVRENWTFPTETPTYLGGVDPPQYSPAQLSLRCLEDASAVLHAVLLGGGDVRATTALDMLYRALLEGDWRAEIVFLMVALEALFGPGDGEVAHQVSERAAAFVYGGRGDVPEMYRRLKRLYRARSTFVHGDMKELPEEKKFELARDLEFLMETVRLALHRVLTDECTSHRFRDKDQSQLDLYLEGEVMKPWMSTIGPPPP